MAKTVAFNKKSRKGIKRQDFHKAVYRGFGQTLDLGVQYSLDEAPVRRGILAGKNGGQPPVSYKIIDNGRKLVGNIGGTARNKETGFDYLPAVIKGTGMHGPKKKRIYPKKKNVLVFITDPELKRPTTKAGWKALREEHPDKIIYAKSSEGMKPNDFIKRGLEKAEDRLKPNIDREIEKLNTTVK